MDEAQEARFAALIGAVVADASALGLHWLYNTERLASIAGDSPEFRSPRAEDYAGGGGYFAHGQLEAGDSSQYGEAHLAFVRGVVAGGGEVEVRRLQRSFQDVFGAGGSWHGYIDHPTRAAVTTLAAGEAAGKEAANALLAQLDAKARHTVQREIAPLVQTLSGEALIAAARSVVVAELADAATSAAQVRDEAQPLASGSEDDQLPGLAAVSAVVCADAGASDLLDRVEAAVRVTHDHDPAVAWASFHALALSKVLQGADVRSALESAAKEVPARGEAIEERIGEALALSEPDAVAAAGHFGRACYLRDGLPIVAYLATRKASFAEAASANVLCGGDSCGRSLALGSLLGAAYGVGGPRGVPYGWLARVRDLPRKVDPCVALASLTR